MAGIRRVVAVLGTAVVVAGGGGAGVVAYRAAHDGPAFPAASASAPPTSAAPSASPVPERSPFELAAPPSAGPAAVPSGVARALAGPLADKALGARVDVSVADATTGATLYDRGGSVAVVPASTAKLFTAAAALRALGPDRRLETRVVAAGTITNGVLRGDLVVVGGGDPTLTAVAGPSGYPQPARLADLARQVRVAGITKVTGGVVVDTALFGTPGLGPAWKASYVTEGSVAPVTAFEVDGGRVKADDAKRVPRPEITGGAKLRDALLRAGVTIGNAVTRGPAPPSAVEVASVESPPVSALVERMLARSDNDLAEALARHVAIARGLRTDFAGASAATAATIRDLGLPAPALLDASGLSPRDRVTPAQLVALLSLATRDAALAPLVQGLPVAGFTGTLATRYTKGSATRAAGLVRAKTGSLDNVATLAGIVETRSGRLLVFAFAADRLPTKFVGAAAKALDVAAAALASCGCA
jgi:D-alanyl-D-alanine carboxypeptidase/D-alanyl-D-alanine-endopeptidase (penicillin-binding protein 4)